MSESHNSKKKSGTIGGISLAVIIVLALVLLMMSYKKVPTGYVGVVYKVSGGVTGKVLGEGGHILLPTERVSKFSIGIEQSYLTADKEGDSPDDDSFEVPTKDGKGLTVDAVFTYRYDQDKVPETYRSFRGMSGKEIKDSFIKPSIMKWTKEVTARYSVTEAIGDKRAEINSVLTEYLQEKFAEYGIIVESVALSDINPDKETRKAIQKKVTAQQEKELAEVEAETARINAEKEKQVAEIEAEKEKSVAEINAEAKLIKAKGDADAKKVTAQAEAEANAKIAASLTNELIDKIKYEKWDGVLPQVSGEGSTIIDMRE